MSNVIEFPQHMKKVVKCEEFEPNTYSFELECGHTGVTGGEKAPTTMRCFVCMFEGKLPDLEGEV